jgi:diguanylate cyclase (GGDEF)-like protein
VSTTASARAQTAAPDDRGTPSEQRGGTVVGDGSGCAFADADRPRVGLLAQLRARADRSDDNEAAPDEHINDRALTSVVINLAPASYLIPAIIVAIVSVMWADVASNRAITWLAVAASSGIATAWAVWDYRANEARVASHGSIAADQRRRGEWALRIAFAICGTTFGLAPWVAGPVAASDAIDTTLTFTLFPATVSAVAAVVTAGRRDMYLAFLIPLSVASSTTMVLSGDRRLQGLGAVALVYCSTLVILHKVVSRGTRRAIDAQWRSEELLRTQASDQVRLTAAYRQLAETNEQLAHQATHDPLTGLVNRRGTIDQLDRLLSFAADGQSVSVLFIDLDRFKAVNDALGHRGGDTFLRVLADRIARAVDRGSVAGRIGGDEFVVVLPNLSSEHALAVAWRLIGVVSQPVHAEGRDMPSSASIGVASSPAHGTTSSELLRSANAALYRAKHSGRNRVEVFDGVMQKELVEQVENEQAIRRAIEDGEIVPYFQPELDATNGNVVGAELLARWVQRDGKIVDAVDWIDTAAATGLLDRVTERVVSGARAQIRRLQLLGLPDGFRFRINMAPESAEKMWRESRLEGMIQGLDPNLLTLDVRETGVGADPSTAAAAMAAFRAMGGRVCLDDFARGVSSLSLLRRLPLDEVRIDRVSVDTLTTHPHDRAIVRSIIALVRELGLTVTADGVETPPQADALIALGCIQQQGHLYSMPLSSESFEEFLSRRMAESFQRAARPRPDWHTRELL